MLAGLLVGALLVMRLVPETPLALILHKLLVQLPLTGLQRLERRHFIHAVILTVLLFSFWEVVAVFGSAELVFAYAANTALYADAIIITSAISAASSLKAAARAVRDRLGYRRPSGATAMRSNARAKRSAAARRETPANDDDGPRRLSIAA